MCVPKHTNKFVLSSAAAEPRLSMRPDTRNWIESAYYDLGVARDLLSSERHMYVVFFCHLALEKMLKAAVTACTREPPPKTHDLIYLLKLAGVELEQEVVDFLGKINNVSVPTRYPEDLAQAIAAFSEVVAQDYLRETEEAMKWLGCSLGWRAS